MIQSEFTFGESDKERVSEQAARTLELLESGPATTVQIQSLIGPRAGAYVHLLRERGDKIGSKRVRSGVALYTLNGYEQRVSVSESMKQAYYATVHWKSMRLKRLALDGWSCCWCESQSGLQVHHWVYELFNESIDDLMTLCSECHEKMHSYKNVQCHFPRYVSSAIAERLR